MSNNTYNYNNSDDSNNPNDNLSNKRNSNDDAHVAFIIVFLGFIFIPLLCFVYIILKAIITDCYNDFKRNRRNRRERRRRNIGNIGQNYNYGYSDDSDSETNNEETYYCNNNIYRIKKISYKLQKVNNNVQYAWIMIKKN